MRIHNIFSENDNDIIVSSKKTHKIMRSEKLALPIFGEVFIVFYDSSGKVSLRIRISPAYNKDML
jgi:hypothetical protein